MNVSSLMAAHDRFLGVQQSPPLAALHHMMETKIPSGPSPPAASLPPPPSSMHHRSYQPHQPLSASSSSSSTPHRIHNILGRAAPPIQISPDVAAGFAAAAAAAAGLVVDPSVCPGYSSAPPPRSACSAARTPCGPAFWSNQATAVKSTVSPVADWNHSAGTYTLFLFYYPFILHLHLFPLVLLTALCQFLIKKKDDDASVSCVSVFAQSFTLCLLSVK